MGKDFAPKHKSPGIASFHNCPGNDPCTGTKIRKALEVDVVENAGAIQRQSPIAYCLQFLAVAMFRTKTRCQTHDVLPSGRRDQDLDPDEIGSPTGAAILVYALADGHGDFPI